MNRRRWLSGMTAAALGAALAACDKLTTSPGVQKTLARKTLSSDAQMRQHISEMTRFIRRVFNETVRFDRWLNQPQINGLSRLDWVPPSKRKHYRRPL